MAQTLFEVLSHQPPIALFQMSYDNKEHTYHSICSHLTRLLNSRQGSLSHLPNYGLPDIAEIYQGLPYSIYTLLTAIEDTIKIYEPRLKEVSVKQYAVYDKNHVLHLQIFATLLDGEKIGFDTFFGRDGFAKIS